MERLCPRNSGVFFSQIFCAPEIPWSNSNPLREHLFRSAMSSYIVGGGRYSDNCYSDISKWVMQWVRVRVRIRARVRVKVTIRVRVSVRNCRNRECRNRNLYPYIVGGGRFCTCSYARTLNVPSKGLFCCGIL